MKKDMKKLVYILLALLLIACDKTEDDSLRELVVNGVM